ncbi:MAG: class I SAM-dependent methyltransferase [Bacteroidia bacterium]|nr:class I SAM-dependent methyltransferase [Bacteroidia bacterium]
MANHFDQVAGDWDKNQMHLDRTEAIAKELIARGELDVQKTALEIGSGTGLLSFTLKDYFSEIILMDSSVEMIKTAREKLAKNGIDHLHPLLFDLEKDEYPGKKFDYIFSQMALHHVDNIEKMFLKFYHLLNPGGHLAIADLYKEDGSFHDADFTGHHGFDPYSLVHLLELTGFHNINLKPCFVIKRPGNSGNEKEFPVFLVTANAVPSGIFDK